MDDTDILLTENNEDTKVKAETNVTSERSVARPRPRSVGNNDGRFSCDECEATFNQSGHLGRHKKSKHEGMRYPCTKCDYKATLQQDLNRHTISKHLGVRYPCPHCEYKATEKG